MKKIFITTTIAESLFFFKGQPRMWKEKFAVCAISSDEERLKEFAEMEGIRYRRIPMKREISLFSDICSLFRLSWFFVNEKPYIVHANTPKASLLSMVAAWITRRPVRIYMCHGLRYQGTQGLLRKLLMWMERVSCACATEVICVSRGCADVMVADGLCAKEKIKVVGYGSAGGVDMAWFDSEKVESQVRRDLGIPEEDFVFIFVGRLVGDKGVNELVNAFDRLCKVKEGIHLVLVGPTELVQDPIIESTVSIIEHNPFIHSVGRQSDVRPYLKSSDAFVLPSYREGFGMVLIEAGSMGLPCITTDITGCNEIIVEGQNGSIVPPRDADALFKKMKIWTEDKGQVAEMAGMARHMVRERYEGQMVRNLYFEKYKSLIDVV